MYLRIILILSVTTSSTLTGSGVSTGILVKVYEEIDIGKLLIQVQTLFVYQHMHFCFLKVFFQQGIARSIWSDYEWKDHFVISNRINKLDRTTIMIGI